MSVARTILDIRKELPPNVSLVAVSKYKSAELIREAYMAGQRDFGENYVQELIDKQMNLPGDVRWHFIGHLQSNKVKYIIPFVHLIHGVDSMKLLKEVNKQAEKVNRVVNCLMQVYIAREESKFGFEFKEVEDLLISAEFARLENIRVVGLMGMATNTEDTEVLRREFLSLSKLAGHLKALLGVTSNFRMEIVSMGMSGDYQLAIACGSNMVRIGSRIFGERSKA